MVSLIAMVVDEGGGLWKPGCADCPPSSPLGGLEGKRVAESEEVRDAGGEGAVCFLSLKLTFQISSLHSISRIVLTVTIQIDTCCIFECEQRGLKNTLVVLICVCCVVLCFFLLCCAVLCSVV